ncbi:hypothetical protein MSAR_26460 [Mycolicibacterium sarraceniae]|uniref:Ankyrin repeat protein n=1 Tax=Mycolicibacterium sarraceniae TaxID=1534348 RepID=A0A7I7SSD8_9MYCO|nr:hypothetical protein MSAR_26460 [Mycolicibacterium sarraceniae]
MEAERFRLHDAQLVVARNYGFSGWPALVGYLAIADELAVDPGGIAEDALSAADQFCALASLRYDHSDAPPRWRAAGELIEANPDVPHHHVWSAASAADPLALSRHLEARPALANTPGGPFGWVPLMYLCYSRLALPRNEDEVLAAAVMLLDAGAGPSPWERRLGEAMETRAQMWQRQIDWASAHGLAGRLALLAGHGIEIGPAELVEHEFPTDPNIRDDGGATPLHHAAWCGDLALIRRLLDAGADPDLVDHRYGTTPRGWAQHAYQTEAAAYLDNWQTRRL